MGGGGDFFVGGGREEREMEGDGLSLVGGRGGVLGECGCLFRGMGVGGKTGRRKRGKGLEVGRV